MQSRWAASFLSVFLAVAPRPVSSEGLTLVPVPSGAQAAAILTSKLAPSLAELWLQTGANSLEMVDVVVALNDSAFTGSAPAADSILAPGVGGVTKGRYARLPFEAMRVPAHELLRLASDSQVRFVARDSAVFGASQAARQAARVPGSSIGLYTPNAAYRGGSVTVAVVDTGVSAHGDFYALAGQFDFVGGALGVPTGPADPFGHGTHVAGMVGADGRHSGNARFRGSATRASVVALRVLDGEGRGSLSDVLRALDWILEVGISQYGIRVANLSLGKGVEESPDLDPLVQAVEAVWDAGVVVVVSAGNHGSSGHYTVTSPGVSRKVITVGSLTENGTGNNYSDDVVSSFSSRGPTLFSHVLKPDLVAPGNKVVAPYSEGSRLGSLLPPSRVVCGLSCDAARYLTLSGTSMAAGVVSGAVARMLEKDPSLAPATIKARLMKSARKLAGDPTLTGAGVLNVEAAMNATGVVSGQALSPLMNLSADGTLVYVQDPAQLWGGEQWSAGYLWPDGHLWSASAGGFLSSNGYLWPDSSLWADAYLWANGFLWPDAVTPASVDIEDPSEETPPEEELP